MERVAYWHSSELWLVSRTVTERVAERLLKELDVSTAWVDCEKENCAAVPSTALASSRSTMQASVILKGRRDVEQRRAAPVARAGRAVAGWGGYTMFPNNCPFSSTKPG
jgi:hypothetical protein